MNAVILTAISERRVLTFWYGGEPRRVEPHCYGRDTRGHDALRAWELSGSEPGWKLFHVTKMTGLQATAERFQWPRPGYKRGDPIMRQIYCEL